MSAHQWVVLVLIGLSVLLIVVCAIGVLVMEHPLEQLHYLSPPASLSALVIALVAFYDGPGLEPGIKASMVAVVLTVMNGVVSHATGRAAWVRAIGRWSDDPKNAERLAARDRNEPPWEDAA